MPELSDQPFDEWRKCILDEVRTDLGKPLYFLTWDVDGWTSFALESRANLSFSVLSSDLEVVREDKTHAVTFSLPSGHFDGWSFGDAPVWISRLRLTAFSTDYEDDVPCEVRIERGTRTRCSCSSEYFFDEMEEVGGYRGREGCETPDGGAAILSAKDDRTNSVARELMDPDHLSKKSSWILKRHCLWGTILSKNPRAALEGSVLRDYGPNKVVVSRTAPAIFAMEVALRSKIDPESKRDVERAFDGPAIDTFNIRKSTWIKIVDAIEKEISFAPISDTRIRVSRADGTSWPESFGFGVGVGVRDRPAFYVGMFVEFVYDSETEKMADFANVLRTMNTSLSRIQEAEDKAEDEAEVEADGEASKGAKSQV